MCRPCFRPGAPRPQKRGLLWICSNAALIRDAKGLRPKPSSASISRGKGGEPARLIAGALSVRIGAGSNPADQKESNLQHRESKSYPQSEIPATQRIGPATQRLTARATVEDTPRLH